MDSGDVPQLAEILKAALAQLPERRRATFLAIRHDDATYAQLAERFGTTPDEIELAFAQALVALVRAADG